MVWECTNKVFPQTKNAKTNNRSVALRLFELLIFTRKINKIIVLLAKKTFYPFVDDAPFSLPLQKVFFRAFADMNSLFKMALIFTLLVPISTVAQSSQKTTAGKANEYGLIYYLPNTVVDIVLEAELAEEIPGEFNNYARRYLGVSDAITKAKKDSKILSVQISERPVANKDQQWIAQFKAGSTPFIMLSAEGAPLSINTEEILTVADPELPTPKAAQPTPLQTPEAKQAITAEMAKSASTSKKAELASQRIFELRETRSDILSGQADNPPSDGKAMQLVLDNLAAQEAALTAMFLGTKTQHTQVNKITLTPDSNGIKETIIARLSAVDGIVDPDDLSGEPITVKIKITQRGKLPAMENGLPKTFPKGGVAYNIPGKGLVEVEFRNKTIASKEITLPQAGTVFGLEPKMFTDKKAPVKAIFDPISGALVELGPAN